MAAAAVTVAAAGAGLLALLVRERRIEARLDRYRDLVWREAETAALPPELLRAVIRAESGGDPRAESGAGARGLMQITPVAREEVRRQAGLPDGDPFDPAWNVRVGTTYLRLLVDRFDGDLHLALAAYHWGEARVRALRRDHPDLAGRELVRRYAPPATARYCRQVLGGRALHLPVGEG